MKTYEKIFKAFLALVVVFGLSVIPLATDRSQVAQVSSSISPFFFGPFNRNDTVLNAQEKLTSLGLYNGNVSGLFGFKTRNAILDFQEMKGLVRNGILDAETQEALFTQEYNPVEDIDTLEYMEIGYTEKGQEFLNDWFFVNGIQEATEVELRGQLLYLEKIPYGEDDYFEGHLFVDQDGIKYAIRNISSNNLSEFENQYVSTKGMLLYSSEGDLPVVVINYVKEDDFGAGFSEINNTKEGDIYLKYVVENKYQEDVEYVRMSGYFGYTRLNSANVFILKDENEKYLVKNISNESLKGFSDTVTMQGFLTKKEGEDGYRVIYLNYVPE